MSGTFTCADCGNQARWSNSARPRRTTKRFCDECLRQHQTNTRRARPQVVREGVCPDCGAPSSAPGRRCVDCGRRFCGTRKSANVKPKHEAMRRTTLALLRDWGARHGGVGPTGAAWDECGYFELSTSRVIRVFGGWLAALDAAGLDYPSYARSPKGRGAPRPRQTDGRFTKIRRTVTGGDLGAKAPHGDVRSLDRTMPYV